MWTQKLSDLLINIWIAPSYNKKAARLCFCNLAVIKYTLENNNP